MIPPFWIPHKFKTSIFGMTNLITVSTFVGRFVSTINGLRMAGPCSVLLVLRRPILIRSISSHHGWSFKIFTFSLHRCVSNIFTADQCIKFFLFGNRILSQNFATDLFHGSNINLKIRLWEEYFYSYVQSSLQVHIYSD